MRGIGFLFLVICALAVIDAQRAQTAEPIADNQLVGTWKLVSVRHGIVGTVGYPDRWNYKDKQTLKHVTPTHTVTVSYYENGAIFTLSGGTYTLEEGKYTETVDYGIDVLKRPLEGKGKRAFDVIVSGTRLHLTMRYGDRGRREELWERIVERAPDEAKPLETKPNGDKPADSSATELEIADHAGPEPAPADGDIEKRGK